VCVATGMTRTASRKSWTQAVAPSLLPALALVLALVLVLAKALPGALMGDPEERCGKAPLLPLQR
jgi:hypothetical protein